MNTASLLAGCAALCFGLGLVTARIGLRAVDARTGAAISVPAATLMFILVAPFVLDWRGF